MRLCWVSAPGWGNTGYAKVTRNVLQRLKYPEQIVAVTSGGLQAGPFVEWNGIKVYPGYTQDHGARDMRITNLEKVMKDTKSDFWVIHNDAWAYRNTVATVGLKYPCITYSPIDGGHISIQEHKALAGAMERVAMCKYAEREIKKVGLSTVYIPHGVDTKVYNPQDKNKWREIFKLPKDAFIVGFVGTNISKRKAFAEMMFGFKKAFDAGKKFIVVMITMPKGQAAGGYNLYELADYIGFPKNLLNFPVDVFNFTEHEMAGWYNAFDILVNITRGEGFGIPIIEAQACGTPVIATDFSAMTELVDGHGILVPVKALDVYTLKTQHHAIADYDVFGDELIKCIDNHDLVKSMGKRAHKFAQKYEWDKIVPKWDRLFRKLDQQGYFPPYRTKEF